MATKCLAVEVQKLEGRYTLGSPQDIELAIDFVQHAILKSFET